ncbi:MAG: competence type IV pilus major pilin ComGC [Ectobacillus sp.]
MNEKGFTLLEMLLVLLVISVLLLLIIPNVVNQRNTVQTKGCEAIVKSTEAQVQAYQLNNDGAIPTIEQLKDEEYIATTTCPNGAALSVSPDTGKVTVGGKQ